MSSAVFISYSHKDEKWKDRLLKQLEVLELQGYLDVWTDRKIEPGGDWYKKIQSAMEMAKVAILLVSANSLTSKFILGEEVVKLLKRRKKGLHIVPIIVSPCNWERVGWLAEMQVRPKDGKPLSGGTKNQVEETLTQIADEVRDIIVSADRKREVERHKSPRIPPMRRVTSQLKATRVKSGVAQRSQQPQIQVIGWEGIEEQKVYDGFRRNVACLVGLGSFDSLPSLTYQTLEFDVVVADIEFLERYYKLRRIRNLYGYSEITAAMSKVHRLVWNATKAIISPENQQYKCGLPIQFGFMEILVNTDAILDSELKARCIASAKGQKVLSYKEFDICDLLKYRKSCWYRLVVLTFTHAVAFATG